jgi:hypothetical protein
MLSWAYIAGFMDGEGSIGICHGLSFTPCIRIAQSGQRGLKLLTEISNWIGEQGIHSSVRSERTKRLPAYIISIQNRDNVAKFINAMMPFLHIKKSECQDALRTMILFPRRTRGKLTPLAKKWHLMNPPTTRKTHCIRGHALTPENVYLHDRNGRVDRGCKQCVAFHGKNNREKKCRQR